MAFVLKDGTQYLPAHNIEIGMNDDLAYSDRAGWTTSVEMVTTGRPEDWTMFGGTEVGNPYDLDPMGEDRSMISQTTSEPTAKGQIGQGSEGSAGRQIGGMVTTTAGKSITVGPQTYSPGNSMKKG